LIYAIRAVGTEFIKFGRASNIGRRLKEMDTSCPHELEILAWADWPDSAENSVHRYLMPDGVKLEWFKDGERAKFVLECMKERDNGLLRLQHKANQDRIKLRAVNG
jgi:hypothetical protein